MPPRKKSITKTIQKTQEEIIIKEVKSVPLSSLKMWHNNPRIGNVDEIAKSLHLNRQFKPIVVNVGSITGRPNEILAGNHTYLGARKDVSWTEEDGTEYHKVGWENIYAAFVDVDETHATKIVLADNRTADLGTYDDSILANIFKNLPDVTGTGYTSIEVDDILSGLNIDVDGALAEDESAATTDELLKGMTLTKDKTPREIEMERRAQDEDAVESSSRRGAAAPVPTEPDELDEIEDVRGELQVVLEMKEDTIYPSENYWGIPKLREDMILESFPEPIQTWGGKDATPDDGKSSYIWIDGLSPITGLPTDGRAIIGFFTYDYKFDKWWQMPAYYTAKVINLGVDKAFVPDYSIWSDDPRVNHLYNTYKGFWLARFFQDAGLKVIPVAFHSDLESIKYTIQGIPKGSPTLCIQAQAINKKEMEEQKVPEGVRQIIEEIAPKELLIYAGNPGHDMVREMDLESEGLKVIYVPNYSAVRRGVVFDKKDGAAKLTPKQKKAIRERELEKHPELAKKKRDDEE